MLPMVLVPVAGTLILVLLRFAFVVGRARIGTRGSKSHEIVRATAPEAMEPSAAPGTGAARTSLPPAATPAPAQSLREHDEGEYRYHSHAQRTARLLRAASAEEAAAAELEHERLREVRMAAALKHMVTPRSPSLAQRAEQAVLDTYEEFLRITRLTRRRTGHSSAPRVPQPSQALRLRALLGRGSRDGVCQLLVEYHLRQLQHYELACNEARRYERENAEDEARARIEDEISWHLDMSHHLSKIPIHLPGRRPGR